MRKLDKKGIEDIFALTPMQEGILLHYLKDPKSELYVEQLCLNISGTIDTKRFEQAWNFVIENNEMLRTLYRWEKVEKPIQIVLKEHKLQFKYYDDDLSGKENRETKSWLEAIKAKDRKQKFDLREVPFRVTLCKVGENKYEMMISNHHILYDGWSSGIILKEFFNAYNHLWSGNKLTRPAKFKFKEFVKWIRKENTDTDKQDEFWKEYLKDVNTTPGLSLKKRKKKEIKETGNFQITVPDEIKDKMEDFVKSHNITIASLLYSSWGILLQRYFSSFDVLFDITVSGRSAKIKGIENMVGLFINTLPFRAQTHPGEKISDFLSRLYHMLQRWGEFENSSLANINECLDGFPQGNLFDSVVVIENYPLDRMLIQEKSPLSVHSFSISPMTHYDLTVIITPFEDIKISITYNKELFEKKSLFILCDCFIDILHDILNQPGKKVSEAGVVPEEERNRLFTVLGRIFDESERAGYEYEYTAPRNELEKKLVEIWSNVLRVDESEIGIDSDFFDFGGHSLKASMLAGRINKEFRVKIPLSEIFKGPTIRQLARYIKEVARETYTSIEIAEEREYYPLSPSQQRMYTLQQMEPQSIAYNVSAAIMVERHLEKKHIKAFEKAFQTIITRHQSLRTSFGLVNGEPVQIIHKHKDVDFHITYIAIEADYQQDATAADGVIQRFIKPFDLAQQPLIRIGLVRLEEAKHLLLFDTHHIIVDGSSMNIFIKEFIAFYSGKELPPVPIQYKDFSQWQRRRSKTEEIKKQEEYWLNIFSGEIPVLNIPTDFPRATGPTGRFEGDTLNFTVSREIRRMLLRLEKESGATLYMILMTAYYLLLMKYSGQEDIVVGTLTDGRSHVDLENIIGVLITTLVMRNYPNREKRFFDFLQEVKNNSLNIFENSEYPFEELLKNIRFNREPERNPLFDTMFLLQNFEWTELSLEGLVFKTYPFKTNASTFDLRVTAVEREEQLDIEIQYATRLFKKAFINRLAAHYINILKELGIDYQKRLGEINILKGEEKQHILHEFNKADRDTGTRKTVYLMFEEQVEKSPGSCAVQVAGETLQYRELNEKSNRLARVLRKRGVQKGHSVGILLPPSPRVVVSIFATWKAGATYIPIDPHYPPQRIEGILKDSNASVILSQTGSFLPEIAEAFEGKIIELDQWEDEILAESSANLELASDIDNLAYIIYTSGSTGKPKGAGVYHRGFFNLMTWFVTEFGLNASDTNLLVTSLSFDLTQKNIFAPLITGGTLTFPGSSYFEPGLILEEIKERGITWLNCTPGMIYKIIEFSEAEDLKKLASLRYLFLGGEPIYMKMLRKWVESENFNAEIVNTYGPTECTDICAYFRVIPPRSFFENSVPTGKPIYNVRLYVLDPSFQPLPVGVPGELWIEGEGIGIGYINDVRLTSERFIKGLLFSPPDGHSPTAHLLYRTGDLVKWLPDGNIEFISRMDFQVKVRGFRIELGEIESQLLNHDKVQSAVVLALDREHLGTEETAAGVDVDVDKYLCAYFVSEETLEVPELRNHLSKQLPEYMIPSYFMQVAKIPLNPHGKIDRKLLPKPDIKIESTGIDGEDRYVEAGSEIERKLVKIWQEILGMQAIGTHHNFFELGGDSLLVIQVIARIREIFNVELPVRTFFQTPFIEELAKEIEVRGKDVVHIPKAPEDAQIPLSFAQEQVWFLHQLNDSNVSYHVPRVIRIRGKLDIGLVERTFNEIMRRHEILRTTFPTINGEPVQHIMEPRPFKLSFIDLSEWGESYQSQMVTQWLNEEGQRPFDFEKGPMIRITLLKLKQEEHLLVNTEHHLIHDGWTQGVLLREFIAIFTAFSQGDSSPLPELPIQYRDFAYWQQEYMQGEVLENHLQYWEEKLPGLAPVLNLPTDRPRPPVISGQGAEKRLFLSKPLTDALKTFSREKEVTLFMTMLTVFKVLLYRYIGIGDICVGTGAANRQYKEMEGMLGMVINTLALRTQLSGEWSFEDCLQHVKTTCLEAFEHQDTPFEKIVERLQPERSLSYSPIFQVVFSFMDTPAERLQLPGVELQVEPAHNRSSKFDINVIVEPPSQERMEETGGRIEIVWEYNTDIFDDGTMDRMLRHYTRLLESILHTPEETLYALPMLSDSEIHQLVYTFNDTSSEYPKEKTIHQLFEEQAEGTGDKIALIGSSYYVGTNGRFIASGTRTLHANITHRELNKKSNRLARLLMEKGVHLGSIVGIMGDRSVEMIIGILGILKAGGAYLPIDADYPEQRKQYMLADSHAEILLTTHHLSEGFSFEKEIIYLEDYKEKEAIHYSSDQFIIHHSDNLAYVIYTSGTTGRPKGTMIQHRSLVNLCYWHIGYFQLTAQDNVTQYADIGFDASVWEIFPSLISGATLHIIDPEIRLDIDALNDYFEKNRITISFLPTPVCHQFMEKENHSLRKLLTGGDKLQYFIKRNYTLYNNYGPTENTVVTTAYLVDTHKENIPIGRPIANTRIYILARDSLQLQPVGVPGELCIAGDGLSRGYLKDSKLTEEKFIINHLIKGERMYRTGDMARWLPDGTIEFLGRMDLQVKIRGFRIELGEIENQLLKHRLIKEAVVIDRKRGEEKYLCSYIVPDSASILTAAELRSYLSNTLPDYMIPSFFVPLDKIPLTPNGKIDRKSLPEPGAVGVDTDIARGYIAPRDAMEKELVEIWAEALNIERKDGLVAAIGIDDNFFDLGGHSLKASILVSRIHKALNVKVPLVEFFKRGCIRELAQYMREAVKDTFTVIAPVEEKEYYPISAAQTRLYLLYQMDDTGISYNIPSMHLLEGAIDKHRLETVLEKLVERHESFKTYFILVNDQPVQKIHKKVEFRIDFYDFKRTQVEVGIEVEKGIPHSPLHFIKRFVRSFDLSQAPLLRVGLMKMEGKKYLLMLDMHHIITDGISMGLFLKEFMGLYAGEELSPLRLQYKDYSEWQQSEQEKGALETQAEYWQQQFREEIPVLELPTDFVRPRFQSFEGRRFSFEINGEETHRLKELALREGTTLYTVLLTIFYIFLSKISNQETIIIGTAVAGRKHTDLEQIIGMFVNTLGLKNQLKGQKTFKEFLVEVNRKTLEAFEHQDYPFEELVEKVAVNRDTSRNPLFDVLLVLQNIDIVEVEIPGLKLQPYEYETNTSKFDLMLEAVEEEENLLFIFEYSTNLFKDATIQRFSIYFKKVITDIIERPLNKISEIEIISEAEREQLLFEFNDTASDYPQDKSVHQLFEEETEKRPGKVAVVYEGQSLTYNELNREANKLATYLQARGVTPGMPVGIMLEASLEMIVGLVAILKAGGAYLPIDPGYPEERKRYILADSSTDVLITTGSLPESVSVDVHIDLFRDEWPIYRASETAPGLNRISIDRKKSGRDKSHPYMIDAERIAYIIYTSGSTGRPKGVMVTHRNIVRLVKNTNYITFNKDDRILQTGALEFDASTFEIWGSLLNGIMLFLADKDKLLVPRELKGTISRNKITIMWLTSPLFNQMVQSDIDIFGGLKNLLVGGDVLSPVHINRVKRRFPRLRIINGYGPTENTTFSTTFLIANEYSENIPIGNPIANSTAYIVDKNDYLQPIGVWGELYVGGDGVSMGYMNNPELTAEKFDQDFQDYQDYQDEKGPAARGPSKVPDNIQGGTGGLAPLLVRGRIYRTGDMARWLTDGTIDFKGRIDQQVKIRGFRIEPGEIEIHLLSHPNIKEAVILARKDDKEDKYLCAYVVPTNEDEAKVSDLKYFLSRDFPDYMIPSYFIAMEKIPLTPNGKVDWRALPEPNEAASGEEYTAPRDFIEEKLTSIWSEVLGIEKPIIGIDADFFELGGHSLKATSLISKIQEAFNVQIPLSEVFSSPTLRDLAGYIRTRQHTQHPGEQYDAIKTAEEREYYTLASAQNRFYILQRMDKENIGYNIPLIMALEGEIDKEKLEESFKKLIARHGSFRTSFHMIEEEPVQKIHDDVNFEIEYYDTLRPVSTIESFSRSFDLSQPPLLRIGLIKEDEKKHILILDIHHIISDGISMDILMEEFIKLYTGEDLPALKFRYKDYSEWQKSNAGKEKSFDQQKFWITKFKDEIPVLDLPTDFPRPSVQNFEGNALSFKMTAEETNRLKKLAVEEGVTLYMILLGAFYIFLSKISGKENIVIGTPVAGRRHAELEGMIGLFVNTLSLRNHIPGAVPLKAFLKQLKENTLEAFENQDFPFEELVTHVSVDRDVSRNPLFDVMFSLQEKERATLELPGLKLTPYKQGNKTARFDITLIAVIGEKNLFFSLEYCTKLFKEDTIRRFINYFKKLLQSIIANCGQKISEIEIIPEKEKHRLLYDFNDTKVKYPEDKLVHQLFEEQVLRTPDNIAIVGRGQGAGGMVLSLTYRELNERSNQLAALLIKKGAESGDINGIMMEHSMEMVIGVLGILKAGGVYLPIDPDYPEERIRYMLADSAAKILLISRDNIPVGAGKQGGPAPLYLPIEDLPAPISEKQPATSSENLAYIIYTSGSTGKPKGVMIEHRSLCNLCFWHNNHYAVTSSDRATKYANFGFDASVWEMFPYLIIGAAIYIINDEIKLDIHQLNNYFETHNITICFLPTQICEQFMTLKNRSFRVLLTGGDKLNSFIKRDYQLANNYGPTENTVVTTSFMVDGSYNNIPIGQPISNTQIYIVDGNNKLQPMGIPGELWISGGSVARGYLNNPELTAERFNRSYSSYRSYNSGDLARWLPDGNIEFLGRIDRQLKIRGFRIEPGEIENRLLMHNDIKEVVVTATGRTGPGTGHLCAYIVSDKTIDTSELREYLSQTSPDYMIPSYFIQLDQFPLNNSGKIDKKALPLPSGERPKLETSYVIPSTWDEIKIADIWKDVLGMDQISIEDSFFELGGNSLDIIKVKDRILESFQVDIPVVNMFRYPTIRSLAGYLKHGKTDESFTDKKHLIFKAVDRSRNKLKEGIRKRRSLQKIGGSLK